MKVAFIGLGNMGNGICARVQKGGFDLTVFNRSPEKMKPFLDAGAKAGKSIADTVKDADLVITSLMDDKSVMETLNGGLLSGMKSGAIHLGVTTNSPDCADAAAKLHAEHGTSYVAGPVVGRPHAAAAGELISLLAGDDTAIEKITPVVMSYSKAIQRISKRHGAANSMKLCVNFTIISIIELMGETYAFAEKAGIDLDVIKEYLENAMGAPFLKLYAGKIRARDFDGKGGFAMKAGLKDVRLMRAAAAANGNRLDFADVLERKLEQGINQGMEQRDWSAVYDITRANAGMK